MMAVLKLELMWNTARDNCFRITAFKLPSLFLSVLQVRGCVSLERQDPAGTELRLRLEESDFRAPLQ